MICYYLYTEKINEPMSDWKYTNQKILIISIRIHHLIILTRILIDLIKKNSDSSIFNQNFD